MSDTQDTAIVESLLAAKLTLSLKAIEKTHLGAHAAAVVTAWLRDTQTATARRTEGSHCG